MYSFLAYCLLGPQYTYGNPRADKHHIWLIATLEEANLDLVLSFKWWFVIQLLALITPQNHDGNEKKTAKEKD